MHGRRGMTMEAYALTDICLLYTSYVELVEGELVDTAADEEEIVE